MPDSGLAYQCECKTYVKNPATAAGFTLVELLIIIVIIAVPAGIGFPLGSDGKCVEQLRSGSTVLALYSSDKSGAIEVRNWS